MADNELVSIVEAAAALGVHGDTARRIAARLGLGQFVGRGGGLVLLRSDIERMRPHVRPKGRPAGSKNKKPRRVTDRE